MRLLISGSGNSKFLPVVLGQRPRISSMLTMTQYTCESDIDIRYMILISYWISFWDASHCNQHLFTFTEDHSASSSQIEMEGIKETQKHRDNWALSVTRGPQQALMISKSQHRGFFFLCLSRQWVKEGITWKEEFWARDEAYKSGPGRDEGTSVS